MTVVTTYASAELGIDAPLITVEVDVSAGLPQTRLVGLPETAVKESRERVKTAITSSGFEYPSRRITINLAPADMPKQGGRYDLAIAVAILAASKQIPSNRLEEFEFLGELSLTGALRPVSGALPAALRVQPENRFMIFAEGNASEAAISARANLYRATHLREVAGHIAGQQLLQTIKPAPAEPTILTTDPLIDVKGQLAAKRALAIAAAGGHNLLMVGPPGTGKTMLAERLVDLMPPLTKKEALEVASIQSVSQANSCRWLERPFRAPHHTATAVAIVGGGNPPKPGEISLAHHGVLFLDELPEFPRSVLEVLREPLENGAIWISRASATVRFPARFQLIAAMNPCPCGFAGDESHHCDCTADAIQRYRNKISGPLLDRIDIHVEVPQLPRGVLSSRANERTEGNGLLKEVAGARDRMYSRQDRPNAQLSGEHLRQTCHLAPSQRTMLDDAVTRLGISARGYFKVLKVARTISDLAGRDRILDEHLMEALGYRRSDRQ